MAWMLRHIHALIAFVPGTTVCRINRPRATFDRLMC
jgi:hypothetical protein